MYWFTVEFGLINETKGKRIYGAGILSSSGETDFSLSDKPFHLEYNVDHILDSSYRKDIFQSKYFIINTFEELFKSLPLLRNGLEVRLSGNQERIR
jgi:phenylalanine-4-hydroxylase